MIEPHRPPSTADTAVRQLTLAMPSDSLGTVQLSCAAPATGTARGVVVWCHGLGGDGTSGMSLTHSWARRGYLVVAPTFGDSIHLVAARHRELGVEPDGRTHERWVLDPPVRRFMIQQMLDWPWRRDRLIVATEVLDAIPQIAADAHVTVDVTRLGVGGHSFGAYVAQLLGGVTIQPPRGEPTSFHDERVRAVAVVSGQGRGQADLVDGSWDRFVVPMLNITGTRDRGAITDDPVWKQEPFLLRPPRDAYQAVLHDADHNLSGVGGASTLYRADESHLSIVRFVTTAFWDAHVAGDDDARAWMRSDQPAVALGDAATWSYR